MIRDAVELVVKALVREGESVDVRAVERDRRTTNHRGARGAGGHGQDHRRQGRTVKALRSLLHAAGQKHDRRYVLELVENERARRR